MSAASERARALLAAVKARGFGTGSLDGYDGWKLLADACSIEGGLLAALAGEVEALEAREPRAEFAAALESLQKYTASKLENARLRKALEAARREHFTGCLALYGMECANACGAGEHNARLDAALKGEG